MTELAHWTAFRIDGRPEDPARSNTSRASGASGH
jgi:hypothetical protein